MRRISMLMLGVLVVGGLGLGLHSASAAPVATTGRPMAPAIGFARTYNTYLLVWAEDRNLGTGLDIYAARTTATGVVVGAEFAVVVAPGDQSDPALVFSERLRDYLVVFTSAGIAGGPGTEPTPGLPPPGGSTPGTPGAPTQPPPPPPPLPLGAGLAWRGVVAERMEAAGVRGVPRPDGDFGDETAFEAAPAVIGEGHLAAPEQATATPVAPTATPGVPPPVTPTGQRDLYGAWLAANGVRISNVFALIASPADDTYPALTALNRSCCDERFALVWREVTGTTVRLSVYEFVGAGYYLVYDSAKGNIAGGGDQSRPTVAVEDSGEYLVAWAETPAGTDNRNVFGRRLNLNAWPYGPILNLASGPADQLYPSLGAARGTGGYLLAWEERNAGAPPDIRTRRLNRNGIPYGAGYTLAGGAPYSFAPSLPAATDRSTLLLVWLDRNAASDHSILGAEVTRDGRRIGPERILVQGGAGPGGVTPIPPPGFPTPPPPPIP